MPTEEEKYDTAFTGNCKKAIPMIKKMLGSETSEPVGNFYFMSLAAGKSPLLMITLKSKDPEGNVVRGRGKAQKKTLKTHASAKWSTGDILIHNGRLIFLPSNGPARGDLMKKAFLEIAKENSRLNVLKKAKFKSIEEIDEPDSEGDAEISDQDMLELGMEPAEIHHALTAMGRDPSLSRLLNPTNLAEVSARTDLLNQNLAKADSRTRYDESGLPCGTLEVEVGGAVPTSFAAALEEPNGTTTSMVDERHTLSVRVIIQIDKEAQALPSEERAAYVEERIDMLRDHYEASQALVDAYQQSI